MSNNLLSAYERQRNTLRERRNVLQSELRKHQTPGFFKIRAKENAEAARVSRDIAYLDRELFRVESQIAERTGFLLGLSMGYNNRVHEHEVHLNKFCTRWIVNCEVYMGKLILVNEIRGGPGGNFVAGHKYTFQNDDGSTHQITTDYGEQLLLKFSDTKPELRTPCSRGGSRIKQRPRKTVRRRSLYKRGRARR